MKTTSLTPEQVRHIATLARIELTDQEVELFAQQLSQVIDYNMAILNQINTDQVEPTSQTTGLTNVWHDGDQPQPSLSQDIALAQARQVEQGQFVVNKVMGEA